MPLSESWLALEQATGGRNVIRGTPEEIKANFYGLVQQLLPLYPAPNGNVETKDGEVDGIKYRIYTPKNAKGKLPLAIWTHGGGFMLGDLDTDHLLCHTISETNNIAVVNVDYRLSPEYKAPAHIDDAFKVYKWAHANASSFGADNTKVLTVGGSAGGIIALALANKAVKDSELKAGLKGIVAIVPGTVHRKNVPKKYQALYKEYSAEADTAPFVDAESVNIFFDHAGLDPKDPSYFVLLAEENHSLFPPTYFISCEFDPLRADSYAMVKALGEKGVKTKHDDFKGLPHFFWMFPQLPESPEFEMKLIAGFEWIKSQF